MATALTAEIGGVFLHNALDPQEPMAITLSPKPFKDRRVDDTNEQEFGARVAMTITIDDESEHTHPIPASTKKYPVDENPQIFPLSGNGSSDNAGVTDPAYEARGGDATHPSDPTNNPVPPLTYVDTLQVYIGQVDVDGTRPDPGPDKNYTQDILTQLNNLQPTIGWLDLNGNGTLGNGGPSHALAKNGTGEIRLDLLAPTLSFPEGEYYIELRAPDKDPKTENPIPNNGGRILYNLYVE